MSASVLDQWLQAPGLTVIYDGECPFCSAYVRMLRLREAVGTVELVNARAQPLLVSECAALGYNLNDGMLAVYSGRTYFGADAIRLLSQLTTASGTLNAAMAHVLKQPAMARFFYPIMRSGRAVTLKLLGREKI